MGLVNADTSEITITALPLHTPQQPAASFWLLVMVFPRNARADPESLRTWPHRAVESRGRRNCLT